MYEPILNKRSNLEYFIRNWNSRIEKLVTKFTACTYCSSGNSYVVLMSEVVGQCSGAVIQLGLCHHNVFVIS